MTTALNILTTILVLGLIIMVHESGHFLMCRITKIGVTEFSIGFGPAIFKRTKGETQYSLRLLPIGGYCLMLGDDDAAADDPRAYLNHSPWERVLVVLGGPIFNFILAFLVALLLTGIAGHLNSTINIVGEGSAAEEAGLKEGDEILSLNNERVYDFREVTIFMQFYKDDKPVHIEYMRDGEKYAMDVTPKYNEEVGRYQLGIIGGYEIDGDYLVVPRPGFLGTIKYSLLEMRYQVKLAYLSIKYIVTGRVGARAVSGVVGVADVMNTTLKEAKEEGGSYGVFLNILNFIILISANLGIMNLLPIPAVDGGKLLFILYELITRRPIPKEKEAIVHGIGFVFLFIVMILVTFKDIWQLFKR